jgi:hypothetical protein
MACLLMTIGLIFFTLADSQVQPEFDPLGKAAYPFECLDHDAVVFVQVFGWFAVP